MPYVAALESITTDGQWNDPDGNVWRVSCTWAVVDDQLECIGFDVASFYEVQKTDQPRPAGVDPRRYGPDRFRRAMPTGARPVSATLLRQMPVATIIERERHKATALVAGLSTTDARSGPKRPSRATMTDGYGRTVTRASLQRRVGAEVVDRFLSAAEAPTDNELRMLRVAAVYARAWEQGADPVQAVVEDLTVARSTAGRLVGRARNEYGFLEPTTERQANGRLTPKARRLMKRYGKD